MLRRDYLVRMIEDMTEILGKVFALKQEKKSVEARTELDELYKRHFRLNAQLLGTLSAKDIVQMFRTGGEIEADKLQSLARLLKEEGDLLASSGEPDEGISRWLKSLHLYLTSALSGADRSLWDWEDKIAELRSLLQDYRLPAETGRLVFRYEEQEGRFDQAENVLFRLLEEEEISKDEGLAFYQRLLRLPPERLEAGGLPEEEVREGLAELESRF
ncbi:hypothetical protein EHV15_02775 [Paenibacillus oralis]|uniref:Tetratricopeptide repeat protein n=1 Tax=Paenibacillus oralis TaxID=2490856 RepID=A0A3P3TXL7_9BACL|nr:DUF6483 family protein [Paenibacillus oralis]RRJ62008.1 hypothetical protein EHV15_02775 [Paenibacillus oralis]